MFKYYNQSKQYFTRNWCSIYTLFNILQLNWWIKVEDQFIIDTLVKAEKDKAWYEAWWAYFSKIYSWFTDKIKLRTWVTVKIKTVSIDSEDFENLVNNWYAFGLWLKKAWRWYSAAIRDWIINEEDINWDYWVDYAHNHTYYKWAILDSLWKVGQKPIKMSLETLRKLVQEWVYYLNARTLYMEDVRLDKYLKMYRDWIVIENVESLPKAHRVALDRASKLRIFKK